MLVSHAKSYQKRHTYKIEVPLSAPIQLLKTSTEDFEGRAVSTSKFVVDDPQTRYKGMSGVDFCLENQIAVGFNSKPVFCQLNSNEIDVKLQESLQRAKVKRESSKFSE